MKAAFLALLTLGSATLFAAAPEWFPFDVNAADEEAALAVLAKAGVETLSWTGATVDVSDFGPVRDLPLKDLSTVLTDADPRWDPWLKGIVAWYRPAEGLSRLWVPRDKQGEASGLLSTLTAAVGKAASGPTPEAPPSSHGTFETTPRMVTGATALVAGVLILMLALVARRRNALVVALVLVVGGGALVVWAGPRGGAVAETPTAEAPAVPDAGADYLHHRWFQENWPYGATWKDWKPGQAWSYPNFIRQDGKIVGRPASLPAADAAWAQAVYQGQNPRNADRIFPREVP